MLKEKQKKRIVILSVIMLVSLFSIGCGNSNNETKQNLSMEETEGTENIVALNMEETETTTDETESTDITESEEQTQEVVKADEQGSEQTVNQGEVGSQEGQESSQKPINGSENSKPSNSTPSTENSVTGQNTQSQGQQTSTQQQSTPSTDTQKPSNSTTNTEKPSTTKPSTEQSTGSQSTQKPSNSTPSTETQKPSTEKPAEQKPSTEKPSTQTPTQPSHQHSWEPVYTTVHHEAIVENQPYTTQELVKESYTETVLVKEAWSEELTGIYVFCFECDQNMTLAAYNKGYTDENAYIDEHMINHMITDGGSQYGDRVVTETINHPAEYETVTHPAEYKTVTHDNWVTTQEAYDEQVISGYKCSCGATK